MSAGRTEQAREPGGYLDVIDRLTRERDEAQRTVRVYERYDVWQGLAAENLRLNGRVDALTAALQELVESHHALEGETISFELRNATVERFEVATNAARALLAGRAATDGNGKACEPWCRATPGHDGACVRPAR